MASLGSRVMNLIEKSELSQKEFASLIGVSPQSLNNYVKNKRVPDIDTINRICDVLGCSADYLIGRDSSVYLPLSAEEKNLIKAWRTADPDLQALIMRSLKLTGSQQKKAVS